MDEHELIDRIRALVPLLEANARQAELDRKPVDEVMAAIAETGCYQFFVPKRYGGYEFDLEAFVEIGMLLGEGCVSTAWVTTFCMEHNWLLALYPQAAQDDIFGRFPYIIAPGSLAPKGTATPVEGGYRVSGRWEWGTGVMHANFVMVGALTPGPDPKVPQLHMVVIPRDEVEVVDTWHVSGMVGTGSNDIVVDDVFVPAHLTQNLADLRDGTSPGAQFHQAPIFRQPMLPVLCLAAASPAVGAARKAVAIYKDWLQSRTVYGTATQQSERSITQARLGHAEVRIQSAQTLLIDIARTVREWGESGNPCPDEERARIRLHIARVVREARDVVQVVMEASGSHAHFLDHPLQRIQRDVNTLSCHTVFDLDVGGELYGRLLLGLPANSPV